MVEMICWITNVTFSIIFESFMSFNLLHLKYRIKIWSSLCTTKYQTIQFWNPATWDRRTWRKFGEHGKDGEQRKDGKHEDPHSSIFEDCLSSGLDDPQDLMFLDSMDFRIL